jgi:poly(hydroxyalkanoate) depolymerase family esterase
LGKYLEETFRLGPAARTYKVHVPRGRRRQSMPLIVMLHGCTQDPDDFAAGTRMNALSDKHSCVVVYPAQPASANLAKCWNWFSPGDQRRDHGEPAMIAGITREVMQAYRIDERQVFIGGFSAGASMSIIMAATYPELYAAIGAHSGLPYLSATNMLSAFAAMRNGAALTQSLGTVGIPIIAFHGEDDHTVNPCNGQQVIFQWRASRQQSEHAGSCAEETGEADGRTYVRTRYLDSEHSLFAEHWVIKKLGHAWSGGSQQGSYTDPNGPDASEEMLRFFLRRTGEPGRTGIFQRLIRTLKSR